MKHKHLTKEDIPTFFIVLGLMLIAFGIELQSILGILIGFTVFVTFSTIGFTYFFIVKEVKFLQEKEKNG